MTASSTSLGGQGLAGNVFSLFEGPEASGALAILPEFRPPEFFRNFPS
jgi:hypothetical protein